MNISNILQLDDIQEAVLHCENLFRTTSENEIPAQHKILNFFSNGKYLNVHFVPLFPI